MKSYIVAFLTLCTLLCIPFGGISAASDELQTVVVGKDETVERSYINAGEMIEVSGTMLDDVIIGGGQVVVDGDIGGDLLVGGGMVTMRGVVNQDMRAAGGQMTISGTILRNVTIAGGNIEFTPESTISGDLAVAGGNVILNGTVEGNVKAGSGNLTIGGVIGGDVDAAVGTLQVTSNASIQGDMTYISDQDARIAQGAVAGSVIQKELPVDAEGFRWFGVRGDEMNEQMKRAAQKVKLSLYVWRFFTMALIGLLWIRMFPLYMKRTAAMVGKDSWKGLGIGFLALIFFPIIAVALLFTVIGIPLGIFAFIAYGILLYLAKFPVVYWLGLTLFSQFDITNRRGWAYIAGLVVYLLMSMLPVAGGIVSFIATLLGLGILLYRQREVYDLARKKQVI